MEKAAEAVRRGAVGWVVINDVEAGMERGWEVEEYLEIHTAVATALNDLRFDPEIRVIGITGATDGEFYSLPRRQRFDDEQRHRDRHNRSKMHEPGLHPRGPKQGVPGAIETLAMITKPVIARVNGRPSAGGCAPWDREAPARRSAPCGTARPHWHRSDGGGAIPAPWS